MPNLLVAGNSTNGGTAISTDTSGTLNIVTGSGSGANAITIDASQNVTFANAISVAGNTTITGTLTATGGVSGGIRSGTAVASTSGTSIDFTSIPSGVKRITVMFNGVSTSSNTAEIYVQIGSGSVETTGYLGTSGSSDGTNLGGANYTTAFGIRVRNAAQLSSGTFVLTSLGSNLWVANGMIGGNSNVNTTWSNGSKTTSGILDRLRITTSTGTDTFDAGSINILYE